LIGKVLGNRYRLIELIGEGGMALVYKAECSLLCRTVAIKILRPQYASDVDFVERFRREARAAASLSHPNVLNIYDVGQDEGIDYIVMEYVPGENLKNIIRREAPFSVKKALEITRQIAEALHHAHQRNIIHRDIKPHNILVTPEGQIKVTDFGIARAISGASLTQAGEVLGSVQYSSPEQAKGGIVGPQSDLYSLGCVLYELLTGRVPFSGDTTVSIALQHLEGEYIPVHELRPDVPQKVENLLNTAMETDPSARYPSALAMLKEISSIQSSLGIDKDFSNADDLPTQVWSPVNMESDQKLRKGWFSWFAVGLGTIFIVSVLVVLFIFNILAPPRPSVPVPDLVGKEVVMARELLNEKKLKLKIISRLYNSTYPMDTIISQRPIPGQTKRIQSEIEVVVSRGPELVRVPVLRGKTKVEAELALEEAGLKLGGLLSDYNKDFPIGTVIKQLPEQHTQIERGASVSITINTQASNEIEVPNFIGRPVTEVQAELSSIGLVYNQAKSTTSDIYPKGIIIDQIPVPYSQVPPGTAMNFMVSSGPANNSTP
jgi:serine/threonine-protein kinase